MERLEKVGIGRDADNETSSGVVKSKLSETEGGSNLPRPTTFYLEFKPPFKLCDVCQRTRTAWRIGRASDIARAPPIWKRTCPYCMSAVEHREMMKLIGAHVRPRYRFKYGDSGKRTG